MRGPIRRASRFAAYAASASLAISGTLLAVTPAGAAPPPAAATDAADWLTGQLSSGLMHNNNFGGFDDYGLSIDTGLALAAVGGHTSTVELISGAIADHINDYIGTGLNLYSGAAAKAAVMAQTAGDDPKAYGGVNLVEKVESTVSATAPRVGRLEDKFDATDPFGGDFANTLGQAFAARALTVDSTATKAAVVTSFLLKQQCSSGYFRLNFSAKSAANQSCVNGTDAPDTDATAATVLQLAPLAGQPAVAAAIAKAKTWLVAQQRCDGSFGGGTSTEGSNANSTGLVAWALGDTPASRQAATWLRAHQATAADSGNSLASQNGAIAYDNAGLATGKSSGITDANSDQWRRATSQAAPGIRWYSAEATPALSLTGTTGFVKAGSHPVLTTSGAAAGTVLCVTGPSTSTRGVATASPLKSAVTVPAGTANRTYTVKDPFGHTDTATLKVLGAKTLPIVTSKYKVKKKRFVTAMITGLVPNEWARIYYKGAFVRSGHATSTGKFVATFKVGKAKGKKSITGFGFFTDIRRGATTIKVVR